MRVFVATATGGTIVVPACSADTTVDEFEAAVDARCSGIEDARLVHGCKQLARGRTLRDYNVQEGSTVQQLLRLRGGGVRRHAPPIHPLSFPPAGSPRARGMMRRQAARPRCPSACSKAAATAPHEPKQCTVTRRCCRAQIFLTFFKTMLGKTIVVELKNDIKIQGAHTRAARPGLCGAPSLRPLPPQACWSRSTSSSTSS